ncbi:hypothetical protein D6T63_15695 [Arthrobacter cheniae]|uniref:Uncharacterized protein n=1 Tax=Arthrobacter cheniae TaxID=1258888 RepID=A0A3A5M3N8_9MICC|nr:DsrE family protein [Arthrobacter cheniae]RJT76911.1 hypothetical protein D6T63_15695 [Arthrobacter cheniae]
MHRTVIHLNEADPAKIQAVLQNTSNLFTALGEEGLQAELVAHGPGITVTTATLAGAFTGPLDDLMSRGLVVCACRNTMTAKGLSSTDLLEGVTIVDSGVAHLVTRQGQGWSYLRP